MQRSKHFLSRPIYWAYSRMCLLHRLGGLGTACSNKDYCSPVLCLESEAKNPFPLFSRLLRLAQEGLGCKHILCPRACSGKPCLAFFSHYLYGSGFAVIYRQTANYQYMRLYVN